MMYISKQAINTERTNGRTQVTKEGRQKTREDDQTDYSKQARQKQKARKSEAKS